MPLSAGATLTWLGFSEAGMVATYDSKARLAWLDGVLLNSEAVFHISRHRKSSLERRRPGWAFWGRHAGHLRLQGAPDLA